MGRHRKNIERDREIFVAWAQGAKRTDLANSYSLSSYTIREVIQREKFELVQLVRRVGSDLERVAEAYGATTEQLNPVFGSILGEIYNFDETERLRQEEIDRSEYNYWRGVFFDQLQIEDLWQPIASCPDQLLIALLWDGTTASIATRTHKYANWLFSGTTINPIAWMRVPGQPKDI